MLHLQWFLQPLTFWWLFGIEWIYETPVALRKVSTSDSIKKFGVTEVAWPSPLSLLYRQPCQILPLLWWFAPIFSLLYAAIFDESTAPTATHGDATKNASPNTPFALLGRFRIWLGCWPWWMVIIKTKTIKGKHNPCEWFFAVHSKTPSLPYACAHLVKAIETINWPPVPAHFRAQPSARGWQAKNKLTMSKNCLSLDAGNSPKMAIINSARLHGSMGFLGMEMRDEDGGREKKKPFPICFIESALQLLCGLFLCVMWCFPMIEIQLNKSACPKRGTSRFVAVYGPPLGQSPLRCASAMKIDFLLKDEWGGKVLINSSPKHPISGSWCCRAQLDCFGRSAIGLTAGMELIEWMDRKEVWLRQKQLGKRTKDIWWFWHLWMIVIDSPLINHKIIHRFPCLIALSGCALCCPRQTQSFMRGFYDAGWLFWCVFHAIGAVNARVSLLDLRGIILRGNTGKVLLIVWECAK